jgi:PIN domain nuclease of toxin-antitoxin system
VILLLDTHVVLWWAAEGRPLTEHARRAIHSASRVTVSAASGWELAIKISAGRLRLEMPFSTIVELSGFQKLPVTLEHIERLIDLPKHHSDPFDRMLVAQAQVEGLTLVSHDRALAAYSVPVIWT